MNNAVPSYSLAQEALPFLLWSRIWSQLVSDEERSEAWEILDLPSTFAAQETAYWNAFHAGLPAAPVALLFHAALNMDGANAREDWMRVSTYLGLKMTDHRLPPDHLAGACEVFAMLIDRSEHLLATELSNRYFQPWCAYAEGKLTNACPSLMALPQHLHIDLQSVLSTF